MTSVDGVTAPTDGARAPGNPIDVLSSAIIALTKLVSFIIVVGCTITVFYAATHTININSQIDLFFSGLLTMFIAVVAGPLFCFIGGYGLIHYVNITPVGAWLLCLPILAAWCFLAYQTAAGFLRG